MQHSEALGREADDPALPAAVAEGRFHELDERTAALCRYAIKLTLEPWNMTRDDVDTVRSVGVDDRGVVDANQVASYFNYVNRVADGLGVELESTWPADLRRPREYSIRARYRPG